MKSVITEQKIKKIARVLNEMDPITIFGLSILGIQASLFTIGTFQKIRALLSECYRKCSHETVASTIVKLAISPVISTVKFPHKHRKLCIKICTYNTLLKNLDKAKDINSRKKLQEKLNKLKQEIETLADQIERGKEHAEGI